MGDFSKTLKFHSRKSTARYAARKSNNLINVPRLSAARAPNESLRVAYTSVGINVGRGDASRIKLYFCLDFNQATQTHVYAHTKTYTYTQPPTHTHIHPPPTHTLVICTYINTRSPASRTRGDIISNINVTNTLCETSSESTARGGCGRWQAGRGSSTGRQETSEKTSYPSMPVDRIPATTTRAHAHTLFVEYMNMHTLLYMPVVASPFWSYRCTRCF